MGLERRGEPLGDAKTAEWKMLAGLTDPVLRGLREVSQEVSSL